MATKRIRVERVQPGDVVLQYGYRYTVTKNVYDHIGNGTHDDPKPRRILIADAWDADPSIYTRDMTLGHLIGAEVTVECDPYVDALDFARRRATAEGKPFAVCAHVGCFGHRAHAPHAAGDIVARPEVFRVIPEATVDTLTCEWAVRTIVEPTPCACGVVGPHDRSTALGCDVEVR